MSKAFPIKQLATRVLRGVGFEVRRAVPPIREALRTPVFDQVDVKTIFDVGAHVGQTASEFAIRFPEAEIYCFEPFEESRREIERRFDGESRVHVVGRAVAEAAGVRRLHINENRDMNSLLPPSRATLSYHLGGATDEKIDVELVTIDAFLEEQSLSRVNLLKIDVEGAELLCLRGAQRALAAGAVDIVQLELGVAPRFEGEARVWDIGQYLIGFGYELYDLFKPKHAPNGQLRVVDALFARGNLVC